MILVVILIVNVHCRIGSLEVALLITAKIADVHCRIGSLEVYR